MANDWILSYEGVALAFGSAESRYSFPRAPEIGMRSTTTDDADRPRADGVAFGVDTFGGRTVTFEIDLVGIDEADVRQRLEVLEHAWRADAVRQTPGAVAELASDSGRVTFGRPRRFVAAEDYKPHGFVDVIADFACADTLWYSGSDQSETITFAPAAGGGLIAPLASPLSTTATSDRSRVITVGGTVPTWPVFEIEGPITDPVVEIVGLFTLEFRTTLAFDQKLVIDTRPWARSVLRNGASLAGTLTRRSQRLSQSSIPPGSHELVLRGVSETSTARATVRWRDAYLTP